MRRIGWALVHALLHGLASDERDAVLGDVLELQTPVGRAFLDVSGLVLRRQAQRLLGWRPALALWGVAIPFAMLIAVLSRFYAEGLAVSVFFYVDNWTPVVLDSPGGRRDLADVLLMQLAGFGTLSVWSWMTGFMIGSLSRATAWVSGVAFALVLFGEFVVVPQHHFSGNAAAFESLVYSAVLPLSLRACFVLGPMSWGMRDGARHLTLGTLTTTVLAIVAAVLTAMASRRIGFAARGGWWHLRSAWELGACQAALWTPLAYLVGAAFWPHRARTMVPGS
jgi:hypothetical protein